MNLRGLSKRLQYLLPEEAPIKLNTSTVPESAKKMWATRPVTGVLERRAHIPLEAQEENVAALRRTSAEQAILTKEVNKTLKGATDEDIEQFNALVTQEQHANDGLGKWIDETDLKLMPISSKAKELHQTWKDTNDLLWITENSKNKREMEREGFHGDASGRIVKNVDDDILNTTGFSGMEIYVPDQKRYINSRTYSGKNIKEEFINKGYDLYEVHPYSIANEDLNYNYILSKDSIGMNKPLPDAILHYAEGGIRQYENGTLFVKIGRLVYGDGKAYWGSPKTLTSGDDINALQKYVDEVKQAINIYKETEGSLPDMQVLLDETDFQYFKVDSAADLFDLIRSPRNPSGIIDPNFEPGIYRSGEKPLNTTGYPDFNSSSKMDTSRLELMNLNNRYFKGRGKILSNINGKQDILEDPRHIMEKSIQRIAYNRNIDKLIETYGEYFKNNFSDVIDTSTGLNPAAVSGKYLVTHAGLKPLKEVAKRDQWKIRAAEHIQHIVNSISGTPTRADKKIIQYWNSWVDVAEDLGPEWWNTAVLEKLKDKNPVRVAQSVVFNAYLGMANASMLWKQPLQILNMLSIYPTETIKAIASTPAVLVAYALRDTKLPFNKIMRQLNATLGFMSADAMEDLIRYMHDYGTFHQISKRPELLGTSMYLKQLKGFQKLNTMFYEIGNDISYLIGDIAAYNISKTKDFKDIARIADDLNFNMTSANVSQLQRNPFGSLVTEFLSYPMGVLSALTGKQFSPMRRLGFFAALLAMWGIKGTFWKDGQPVLYDYLNRHTELTPEQTGLVLDGILTNMMSTLGYDVREGPDIAGIFIPMWNTVSALIDRNGEAPSLPASGIMPLTVDLYRTIKDILNPDTDGNDLMYWLRVINQRSGLPTGVRNASKAMYAFAEKKILDKYGNVIKEGVEDKDVAMLAFGFKPIEEREINDTRALTKYYQDSIDDYIDAHVKPAITRYLQYNQTNEEYSTEEWLETHAALRNSIAAGRAWIEEDRPEFFSYYNNRINSLLNTGKNTKDAMSKVQKAIYEHYIINRRQ